MGMESVYKLSVILNLVDNLSGQMNSVQVVIPCYHLVWYNLPTAAFCLSDRDFALKIKTPVLPVNSRQSRGYQFGVLNYCFFLYNHSKRTPFIV